MPTVPCTTTWVACQGTARHVLEAHHGCDAQTYWATVVVNLLALWAEMALDHCVWLTIMELTFQPGIIWKDVRYDRMSDE